MSGALQVAVASVGALLLFLAVCAVFFGFSMGIVWIVGRFTPLVPGRGRRRG